MPARGTGAPTDLAASLMPSTATTTSTATTRASSGNPSLRDASTGQAVSATPTSMVPLSAIARFDERPTATSVNHQDAELATTISYNLAEGADAGRRPAGGARRRGEIRMPINVRGSFQGTARQAQETNQSSRC